MNRHRITGTGARIGSARWIKPDNNDWKRHTIQPTPRMGLIAHIIAAFRAGRGG